MLRLGWDMDLTLLLSDLDSAYEACTRIAANEGHIEDVLKHQEKERVKAEKVALKAARREQDSDEEEEEDEDEEETEEDAVENATITPVVLHADVAACKNLILSLKNALLELVLPLSCGSLVPDVYSNLCTALGDAQDFSERIRQELSIPQETVLGPIPSGYSDEVGIELWRDVLSISPDAGTKKSAPAKGKGEAVSDETRKKYIGQLYGEFYKVIVSAVEAALASADETLEKAAVAANKYADIEQFACVRQRDLAETDTVFMSIDAETFSVHTHTGAYDAKVVAQTKVALQIWQLVECGAVRIVLVCESASDVFGDSLAASANDVVMAINRYKASLPDKVLRKSSAAKNQYVSSGCQNIAELQHSLRNRAESKDVIQIYLVNNLQTKGIVPSDVVYEEPLSDDEEGPITIGLAEKKAVDLDSWRSAPARKRDVSVAGSDAPESVSVDVADALSSLVLSSEALWIENSPSSLCDPLQNKHLHRVAAAEKRLLSLELREFAVWSGVVKYANCCQFGGSDHTDIESVASLADYFSHLYPTIAGSPSPYINSYAIVGGMLSASKLRLLHSLCDTAGTIIIAGEVALPFLACTRRIVFPAHEAAYGVYIQSCAAVLKKSKCRGVRVILPVDVIVGDENVSTELRNKPSLLFDKDARDEGADYDGESKPLTLPTGPSSATEKWPVVSGHVLDIGPETCALLRSEITSCDLLLSWGPVGCCEVSSFQAGQRALITAVLQRNGITTDGRLNPKPLHCVVLGDATVEWWARFSDPEGEAAGDLVRIGVASFASRVSSGFIGVLSNSPSPTLQYVVRRTPESAWNFDVLHPKEVEEDEEDEEEEDDN